MSTFFQGVTGVAIVLVAVILILGVLNMVRGSSPNRSQNLMRWRVILQFTAIVAMMAALYFSQH
jgi:di/tricarboxylate transporter